MARKPSSKKNSLPTFSMTQSSIPLYLAALFFFCCCFRQHFADAGIIQGFKTDLPSLNDLTPVFDHATRQLKLKLSGAAAAEEDERGGTPPSQHRAVQVEEVVEIVDTTTASAPRGDKADSAPGIDPIEVSFMIVRFETSPRFVYEE